MMGPKSTSGKHRIIVDLSYPPDRCVNADIPRRKYIGVPHSYRLPSVEDLGRRIVKQGRVAYMWSADVSRAYHQLQANPLTLHLLGIIIEAKCYAQCYGCRTSGLACDWVMGHLADEAPGFSHPRLCGRLCWLQDFTDSGAPGI